jgi:ectoine hydroxylase-related dioxygenase (phytanoyl-CoA dioxygenase family)
VELQTHTFKVNDLYLNFEDIRQAALHERLVPRLRQLLGDEPVLVNSLNLDHGSQQRDHVDSLFMTPRTPGKLAASWIALEDSRPDAGPLRYYPGSHEIPLYQFSNGGPHFVAAEMGQWHAYIDGQLRERGLEAKTFAARRGDLLLWHANLVHGGEPVRNPALTRKSLVCHYWALADCRALGLDVVPMGQGGYWYRRGPQPVDGSPPSPTGLRRVVGGVKRRLRGLLQRT